MAWWCIRTLRGITHDEFIQLLTLTSLEFSWQTASWKIHANVKLLIPFHWYWKGIWCCMLACGRSTGRALTHPISNVGVWAMGWQLVRSSGIWCCMLACGRSTGRVAMHPISNSGVWAMGWQLVPDLSHHGSPLYASCFAMSVESMPNVHPNW